jgi:signal transduction histidine kinase
VAPVEQDIRTLIDESLMLTEHEFHAKNIRLIKNYAADLPMIAVDANQMKQVFINLIQNGIDAMPKKGKLTVDVQMTKDDEDKRILQLTFKDTGHGIPEGIIERIFDPFFTTKAIGNTGLGLAISKGIIDMHGGIIYAENLQAEGAAMVIRLPLPS